MHLIDDPDYGVIHGDKSLGKRLGRLSRADEVDKLSRSGHLNRVGGNHRATGLLLMFVERLNHEKADPLETFCLLGGNNTSKNAGQLHP
jgi:hypothetical protein